MSKVLPPLREAVASGAALAEPSTSLRLGPDGPRVLICSGHRADLLHKRLGALVTCLQLIADLRRDSAFGGIGLDVLDHLDLGRAVIADDLAGLIRRCMPFARRLDQLAFLLRVVAQRNEAVLAGLRLSAAALRRWRGRRENPGPPASGAAPPENGEAAGGAPTLARGAAPLTGGKAGSLATGPACWPGSGAGNAPCASAECA